MAEPLTTLSSIAFALALSEFLLGALLVLSGLAPVTGAVRAEGGRRQRAVLEEYF